MSLSAHPLDYCDDDDKVYYIYEPSSYKETVFNPIGRTLSLGRRSNAETRTEETLRLQEICICTIHKDGEGEEEMDRCGTERLKEPRIRLELS